MVGISFTDAANKPLREELTSTLELSTTSDLTVGEFMTFDICKNNEHQEKIAPSSPWLDVECMPLRKRKSYDDGGGDSHTISLSYTPIPRILPRVRPIAPHPVLTALLGRLHG